MGGGCISEGEMYYTNQGKVFIKKNTDPIARTMFEGEMASLLAIEKTKSLRVPHPIAVVNNPEGPGAILVMEYLDMTYLSDQAELGRALGRLHIDNRMKEGTEEYIDKFGFGVVTCCGSIPQANKWDSSWVNFFEHKLKEQGDLLNDPDLMELLPQLLDKIPSLFEGIEVKPSLVHGDLWSGNAAQCHGQPVIFDAASFYGHDEYDLGISGIFCGFSKEFFDAYHEIVPRVRGFEHRHKLYGLFHSLNHWNLFGLGYKTSSIRGVKEIINL